MSEIAENKAQYYKTGKLISFKRRVAENNISSQAHSSAKRVVIQTSNAQVAAHTEQPSQIMFDRRELNEILRIYGFKVIAGEWRDYAIDHLKDKAVFSVFRKSSEVALYRIEKCPKLSRKQGTYSVLTVAGVVLKRGSDLRQVLRVFEKKTKLRIL